MTLEVTPDQVPQLIPGAPVPAEAHVQLALVWARSQLARRRVDADTLTGDALLAARTAVAARALALKAGFGGVVGLDVAAATSVRKVKVGAIELELPTPTDPDGHAVKAEAAWTTFADTLLALAVPARPFGGLFPGAAR